MNKLRLLVLAVGLLAVLAIGVACDDSEQETPTSDAQTARQIESSSASNSQPAASLTESARTSDSASMQSKSATTQSGIWVTGEGSLTVEPDLVLLNLGVDTRGDTVTEANHKASTAMDAIVAALRNRGVQENDIQTHRFSIYPQYDYREETVDGVRTGKEVLVGYRVRNSATAKIRDLEAIGEIVEETVLAGGDSIRIEGINFTVEDPKPKMAELRQKAVEDARSKAQHLADLTGVGLGSLAFISDGVAASPFSQFFGFAQERAQFSMTDSAASAPSISGGELKLSLTVQAAFNIQ